MLTKKKTTAIEPRETKHRASKYSKFIASGGLTLCAGWAQRGLTDDEIAGNIGVSRSTLSEWKKKHPDFKEAFTYGKEYANIVLENALFKAAVGYDETEIIEDTNEFDEKRTRTIKRFHPPNVQATIFLLKNRMPDRYTDRRETQANLPDTETATGIVILPEIREDN